MTEDKCTCDDPQSLTSDGQCYNCWSKDVDRQFPSTINWDYPALAFLVALITAFVILALGAGVQP